jgi:hypothetical protein
MAGRTLRNVPREIRIPQTCTDRRQLTFAQIILRMSPRATPTIFEGARFRTGSRVTECELRPTPDYPEIPLLLEYAGNDRTGRGHRRSNDIHVLWKFESETSEWIELARVTSQGPEWFEHLGPIMRDHLRGGPNANEAEVAGKATRRILELMDRELESLARDGRERAMSFLYDAFTARLMAA